MAHDSRPLSPDMQIYRPQLTSVLSISHRITGVALSVGTLLVVAWLIAVAAGSQAYSVAQSFSNSWLGILHDAGMDIFAFLSSLQRHSASRLGRWLRF